MKIALSKFLNCFSENRKTELLVYILLVIICPVTLAQENISSDTSFNNIDDNGLKQGHWKKYYDDGNPEYEGYFKNDKPVGEFKRFFPGNKIKAIMNYKEDGKTVKATLFYQNAKKAAEGTFIDMKKEGQWKYFSFYGGYLSSLENYINGKKDGVSYKYYENGIITEEIHWKNGIKQGKWTRYYLNENPVVSSTYLNDKLHGDYEAFYHDGNLKVKGIYWKDTRHGKWLYYNEKGEIKLTIKYNYGEVLNKDELNEYERKIFESFEKEEGKFKEPDIRDIRMKH